MCGSAAALTVVGIFYPVQLISQIVRKAFIPVAEQYFGFGHATQLYMRSVSTHASARWPRSFATPSTWKAPSHRGQLSIGHPQGRCGAVGAYNGLFVGLRFAGATGPAGPGLRRRASWLVRHEQWRGFMTLLPFLILIRFDLEPGGFLR
jgi:hypothetical protein